MLKIFICEDSSEQLKRIADIIDDIVMIENLDMKIELATQKPNDILDYIKENDISGLYFLDVDLKDKINGLKLAEQIRKHDPRGFIVFITTHAEMSYLTFLYKVEAMDYIIKDNYNNIKERVHQCILNANEKYTSKTTNIQKVFTIKSDDKIITIEYNKILFFETSSVIHKVIVHAIDRRMEFYATMKELEDKLDDRFYRCHKSFIVNKDYIKELDMKNRVALMENGEECFISTRLIKGLLKKDA